MATEIEMKLSFTELKSEPSLEALTEVLAGEDLNVKIKENRLENAYFDTPDFSLNKNKVALRIRQFINSQGDQVFIQTFKTAGQSVDGFSQRGEWEWYLAENKLDVTQLKQCEAWPVSIDTENLVTLFETNFTRYIFDVEWADSVVELVLDWGEILSNNQQEKIHEIELELKQGNQQDLIALANVLMEKLPLRASDISKAERGVKLFQTSK